MTSKDYSHHSALRACEFGDAARHDSRIGRSVMSCQSQQENRLQARRRVLRDMYHMFVGRLTLARSETVDLPAVAQPRRAHDGCKTPS
jgi:hypothetical protein